MSSSDWRNVRIKEEPVSDYEGGSSRPRRRSRSRSLSGERDRRRRDRSRERYREVPPPIKQERDRDRRRESSRDRDRDRAAPRRIKTEARSRSRSPDRRRRGPSVDREDRRHRPSDNRQSHGGRDRDRSRPSDGNRERDWDNFFNPNSTMSKEAYVKREREEKERKMAVGEFGKKEEESEKPKEKEQPNFGLSGKLTEEANTFRGVVIKYAEPPEARKPNKIRWRLYPFKGEEALPVMYVHRQSAYLLGRDRKIADIPVDHPSCSKQHAVLQYRLVPYIRPDGSKGRRIRPYVIDLESANGTFVNGNKIDSKRYVELFEKDVLKFGFSSREYVLLHDESKGTEDDYQEMTPD